MNSTRVIKKPILTEKSLVEANNGDYTFAVDINASKHQIAKAVKEIFKVDVLKVKTRVTKGKSKRVLRTRKTTTLGPIKKATVRLGKEQKIDIFEVKG